RGYSNAADVRKFAYWDVFAGAFGHTYGNHSIWQFYSPKKPAVNGPLDHWPIAKDKPGAAQMQHLRTLIESRPFLTRIPDQSLLAGDPSAGAKRILATRDSEGSYAFVYIPASRSFAVNMDKLGGDVVRCWWFNPRSGTASEFGQYPGKGTRSFTPPNEGENTDWVLVLDRADRKFKPPGLDAGGGPPTRQ
ncbi:MAG TPA: putative collagen-binding domain-containing protein, partial [Planctomycetia bacterium]|nr:putative collagen-binding domain-containing protein [Planctomycetia bacterium]